MNEITIYNAITNDERKPYSSLVPDTAENATALYNAMNNPDYKLSDFINVEIEVKDMFIEPVEMVDNETGELKTNPRIVLFDTKKQTYYTVSVGIYQSLRNICAMINSPEQWKSPIKVKIVQRTVKRGSMLTLEVTDWGSNY